MAFCKTQDWSQSQAPYWMRRLEERYQRLHAKIISQAGRFTHRRTGTTRVLRESQLKHTICKVNTAQDGLSNDQELSVDTSTAVPETGAQGGINKAIIQSHYVSPASRAKTAKFITECVSKQSGDPSINPRPQTQKGTRSSGLDTVASGQVDGNSNSPYKDTPISSGVVTRVSSAYPFTRLSSAYDLSRPSPRNLSRLEQIDQENHAHELNLALHYRLENEENESEENDDVFEKELCLHLPENGYDSRLSYEDQGYDVMNVKCHTDREDVAGRGRRRRRAVTRPVKTSVSRISHKTSKSCPATLTGVLDTSKGNFDWNIQSGNDNSNNNELGRRSNTLNSNVVIPTKSPASLEPLTPQGLQAGRMRVFARMSTEARHAIDETLKEMKMEEEMQVTKPDDGEDNPSCIEDESLNNVNTSADSIRNNVSMRTGEEPSVDQRLKLLNDRICAQTGDMLSSNASIASSESHNIYATNKDRGVGNSKSCVSKNTTSRTKANTLAASSRDYNNNSILGSSLDNKQINFSRKLPQLEENVAFQEKFPNPHAPLPAIKRINMMAFRESTFEITPPDFDIRFREIITCQKGDRETPPLDVRQQSIDKCEQWLIRYTPRR